MQSNGEIWVQCRVMRKRDLIQVACQPGFHLYEEAARTELRRRQASVGIAGRDPHTVFHDLETCPCGICCALRVPRRKSRAVARTAN